MTSRRGFPLLPLPRPRDDFGSANCARSVLSLLVVTPSRLYRANDHHLLSVAAGPPDRRQNCRFLLHRVFTPCEHPDNFAPPARWTQTDSPKLGANHPLSGWPLRQRPLEVRRFPHILH